MKPLLTFVLFSATLAATAQSKLASYSTGAYGTDEYEHLSFWVKEGRRSEVFYSYGKNPREIRLRFLGVTRLGNRDCLALRFPNQYILYVSLKGNSLNATDVMNKYNKTFSWEYQGPVNGVGTFCDVCAQDEEEAAQYVRAFFRN